MERQNWDARYFGLAVYFWIAVGFLLFPIFIVIPLSFGDGQFLKFPPDALSLRWYEVYVNDPVWMDATFVSLRVAFASGILATVIGTMAVLGLERGQLRYKSQTTYFITSPILLPHIFIALGVFIVAVRIGLGDSELVLAGAHATISVPFVVLIVGGALRQIDPTIERAARVLGAGPFKAFAAATLPSLIPSLAAAFVFTFFVSFDELIIAEFVMSSKETLPMRIWADLKLDVSPTVAAVASILIVVTTAAMVGAELLRRRSAGSASPPAH
jgi:putative spermidine/putrescine transport system permease protein